MGTLPRPVGSQEKRDALDRVLQSQTFARADQLKKFLRYVCEMEMAGRAEEISEYSIAVDALGRNSDYSAADDSTVRGRARDLRLKLQQFYHLECPDESIRITLQKGAYTPLFLAVDAEARPPEISEPGAVHTPVRSTRLSLRFSLTVLSLLVAGIAVAAFLILSSTRQSDPVQEIWGPLLRRDAGVLLCVANPPSFVFKRFREPPRGEEYQPAPPAITEWLSGTPSLDGGSLPYIFRVGSPMFGDLAAAVTGAQTLSAAGVPFQLLAESSIRPDALRARNVLLIGAPSYSTYAARVLRTTPFTIRLDAASSAEVISDGPPESKPRRVFAAKRDETGALDVAYGLVTVFPSQAAVTDGPRTAIFSGITGAGAQAAMEFFPSRAGLGLLLARFQKDGLKRVPASYQVVVRCTIDHIMLLIDSKKEVYDGKSISQRREYAGSNHRISRYSPGCRSPGACTVKLTGPGIGRGGEEAPHTSDRRSGARLCSSRHRRQDTQAE